MIKNPISYPGNKNRIVSQLMSIIPQNYGSFVDVFCGSAVVAVNHSAKNIILNDINSYILQILKYQYGCSFETIVSDIEKIIEEYGLTYTRMHEKNFYKELKHEGLSRYNKIGYLKLKEDYNKSGDVKKLFALLIYGFNHYLRFNKNGEFNVPVGKVDFSDSIYNELKKFVELFSTKNVVFSNKNYYDNSLYTNKNAFYYFDPPYLITTAPYNNLWNEHNEVRLLSLLDELNTNGYKFALSNVLKSNGKENIILQDWCKKYKVYDITRQYKNANYQKKNVADTVEVLICNF